MLNIVVLDYGDTCHKSAGRAKASKSSVLVFAWLTLLRFQPFVRANTCGLHSAFEKTLAFSCSCVFSDCLPTRMHNHSDCICLTFSPLCTFDIAELVRRAQHGTACYS